MAFKNEAFWGHSEPLKIRIVGCRTGLKLKKLKGFPGMEYEGLVLRIFEKLMKQYSNQKSTNGKILRCVLHICIVF